MHTTLALSGAERLSNSMVVDHNIKQEIVRQKLDAISIIKAHLGGETLAESIIAGVATLANVAVSPLFHLHCCLHAGSLLSPLGCCSAKIVT